MKLCLFGGSFDPVHCGHLAIAEAAVQQVGIEKVLFLPAARSPFKTEHQHEFSDEERLAMLRAATAEFPWAETSDMDLRLPPPSWSWRLVEHCKEEYPTAKLYWLMGTDQWEQLHRWARYDYLTAELTFIVYHRGTAPQPRPGVHSHFIKGHHPASSSAIRAALSAGLPLSDDWLPPVVKNLISQFHKKS